jgi:hypothetical protein
LKIVSNNSEQEIAGNRAREEAEQAAVDLTANLIRIVRGAGRPHDIREQILRLALAMEAHREAGFGFPVDAMAEAIRLPDELRQTEGLSDRGIGLALARQATVNGALQYTASAILDQPLPLRRGEQQMMDGVRGFESIWADIRREAKVARPKRAKKAKAATANGRRRATIPTAPKAKQ